MARAFASGGLFLDYGAAAWWRSFFFCVFCSHSNGALPHMTLQRFIRLQNEKKGKGKDRKVQDWKKEWEPKAVRENAKVTVQRVEPGDAGVPTVRRKTQCSQCSCDVKCLGALYQGRSAIIYFGCGKTVSFALGTGSETFVILGFLP